MDLDSPEPDMSHQGAQSNEAGVWTPYKDEIPVRCIANRPAITVITSRYLRDFLGSECLLWFDELTDIIKYWALARILQQPSKLKAFEDHCEKAQGTKAVNLKDKYWTARDNILLPICGDTLCELSLVYLYNMYFLRIFRSSLRVVRR